MMMELPAIFAVSDAQLVVWSLAGVAALWLCLRLMKAVAGLLLKLFWVVLVLGAAAVVYWFIAGS